MKFLNVSVVLLASAVFALPSPVAADVIVLKSGHKIEGDVLKERPTELLVDIGIEILRVPRDKIESRSKKFFREVRTQETLNLNTLNTMRQV